jgi:hypothetical protein
MALEELDNSFPCPVRVQHPWKLVCKILEYQIQGVNNTRGPKNVLMHLQGVEEIIQFQISI